MANEPKGSPRWAMSDEDWSKVWKGLLIAAGGAALTYIEQLLPTVNFGNWTPVAVAINSAIVNLLRKLIADNT